MRSPTQLYVNLDFAYKFYSNFFIYKTTHYLSIAVRRTPFAFFLAMATAVQKTFTTGVGQMQRRGHPMTVCGL